MEEVRVDYRNLEVASLLSMANDQEKPNYMPISLFNFSPFKQIWSLTPLTEAVHTFPVQD